MNKIKQISDWLKESGNAQPGDTVHVSLSPELVMPEIARLQAENTLLKQQLIDASKF